MDAYEDLSALRQPAAELLSCLGQPDMAPAYRRLLDGIEAFESRWELVEKGSLAERFGPELADADAAYQVLTELCAAMEDELDEHDPELLEEARDLLEDYLS